MSGIVVVTYWLHFFEKLIWKLIIIIVSLLCHLVLSRVSVVVSLQAQELTGIALPKYYNPGAVNPLKYAEQIQKRKLLWSKAKEKKEVSVLTFALSVRNTTVYGNSYCYFFLILRNILEIIHTRLC